MPRLPKIHALAVIDPGAELAEGVEIGPFCYVESGVVIGADTVLDSHVTIKGGTTMGARNFVGQGTVLGGDPQDRKYQGEPTYLKIGVDNKFREYVTIHRATGEGRSKILGDDNFIMAYTHFGHNVVLHNHITVANGTNIAGHCTIEDSAVVGGMVGIHQFCRIGKVAMVGAMTHMNRDAPPFMITEGLEGAVLDINAVGLRRFGITSESRLALHKACKLMYKSQLGMRNALEIIRREVPLTEEVLYVIEFEERRMKGKNGRADQP